MNQSDFQNTWQRLANGEPIEPQETLAFAEQMVEDEAVCMQVADERTIDALLQLHGLSRPSHEAFVNACVNRIANAATGTNESTGSHGSSDKNVDVNIAPMITGLGAVIDDSVTAAESDSAFTIPIPTSGPTAGGLQRKHKRSRRNSRPIWLAAATGLILMLGASAWIFLKPPGNGSEGVNAKGESGEANRPKVVDAAPVGRPVVTDENRSDDPTFVAPPNAVDPLDRAIDQMFRENAQPKQITNSTENKKAPTEFGNPLDLNAGNQADAPPINDPMLNEPVQPWVIGPRSGNGQTFATLVKAGDIEISSSGIDPRLGQQDVFILSGQGRIDFDCGIQIVFQAPVRMSLNSENSILLQEGNFIFDAPSNSSGFDIQTKSNRWQIGERSELQIRVQPSGQLEAFVHRGTARVAPRLVSDINTALRLSFARLNQVYSRPLGDSGTASITLARGKNQFKSHIGIAGQVWESDSLAEVKMVSNGLSLREDQVDEAEFKSKWTDFVADAKMLNRRKDDFNEDMVSLVADLMQPLENEEGLFGAPDNSTDSTFDGIITIDGQQRKFNSKADYDRAVRDAIQNGMPDFINGQNGMDGGIGVPIGGPPNNFDQAIDIFGPLQHFSDPADFNTLRKQLRK